ncbi:MAG: MFS transporter [Deltaproteobacteria bacterium]|nr:MFS transporter [Deltaproteobacteria bacterium]MBI3388277.1 MFS transporter [Deltaproteobacteria bacterium]
MNSRETSTATLLVTYGGLRTVLFPIPIITIFWKDQIGMSLTDIMLLQTMFSIAAVLFEFPSGYAADRLGRRTSLLIGAVLWIAGWLLYAMGTSFIGMIAAEVVLGGGIAFASGADSALLFTALQQSDRTGEYPRWEGRLRAASQTSEAMSSALGGYLYALSPRLPFWLQLPFALMTLGTVTAMQEPPREHASQQVSHMVEAWRIVRHTLLHHARLRAAVALSVVLSLSTFVMVWLIQLYMQSRGIPEFWFGPLWAFASLYLASVSLFSARVAQRTSRNAVLFACCLLIPIGYGALAFSTSANAVTFYLCFMTIRGLQAPILVSALQNDAPDDTRASVLSLNALCFRLGFVLIGPPVGMLVDRLGMETTLMLLGIVFSTAALAAFSAFRRAHALAT